jgi:amino acid transporter
MTTSEDSDLVRQAGNRSESKGRNRADSSIFDPLPDSQRATVAAEVPPPEKKSLLQRLNGSDPGGLGTFQGVYRPTILTILGVIMYLREGWIVGQAGLLGGIAIILLTFVITGSAAMSLASITTNIRVGAGGVFSIISQSLGLEPGGSIGIPLYLGQALSAALYIYGFSEAWRYLFPDHPQMVVAYVMFAVTFGLTLLSTRLAFKVQGLVLFVIVASFVSIALGLTGLGGTQNFHNPTLIGTFEAGGFWILFAIFFPAGTGIKVGASMSGALANPRRSIPRGTLAAVGTALGVYIFMAIWYSVVASPEELRTNTLVVVERAAWGPIVLAGILASTFTATLSSMAAAPRVLQALGEHGIVPRRQFIAKLSVDGEPRNAALATAGLIAAALLLGSLDRVAVIITMFFLLTYLTINIVILVEQTLGMISFRPMFRISRAIPLVGTIACLLALFVISPTFALVALSIIAAIYVFLVGRQLETPWQTVRSSLFVSMADWAAKRVARTPNEANERAWKPDVLVPVESRTQLDGNFRFLTLLTRPKGSIQIIGVKTVIPDPRDEMEQEETGLAEPSSPGRALPIPTPLGLPQSSEVSEDNDSTDAPEPDGDDRWKPKLPRPREVQKTMPGLPVEPRDETPRPRRQIVVGGQGLDRLQPVVDDFKEEGLFTTAVTLEAPSFVKGVEMAVAVMQGGYFRPNILFVNAHLYDQTTLQSLLDMARAHHMGVAFLYEHPEASLGHERRLNIWVRDQSPNWQLGLRLANLDLSLLLGYQIWRNWQGDFRLLTVCSDPIEVHHGEVYLRQLIDDARLPRQAQCWVQHGSLMQKVAEAPRADLQVLGLADHVDLVFMERMVQMSGSSCLFVRDSGRESALA